MLFESEMRAIETETINGYEVFNRVAERALAEAKRITKRKKRQIEKLGITMEQAIENALRRR